MEMTLQAIYARCEEVGDCLEWQGRVQNGTPQAWDGERYVSVRRFVIEQERGFAISPRFRCSPKCENERCISNAHIALRTYSQIALIAGRNGKSSSPAARAALTRGRRSRPDVKLDMEKARAMRASDLSDSEEARRHGVSRALVSMVRRNLIWREHLSGASVFNMG